MQRNKATWCFAGFIICLSLSALATVAQEQKLKRNDVPSAVIAAFKSAYPKAKVRGYAKEKENGNVLYEIESTDGSTQRDILYKSDGSVVSIEETIQANDLPAEAKQFLRTKYPWVVITKVEKLIEVEKIEFEVSARPGKKAISFVFDGDGTLLRSNIP